VTSTDTKTEVVFSRRGRHLYKAIWRYITAVAAHIWTKLGKLMQNKMQIKGKWSRTEPEVEFRYGRRLFFQTRSRYISAINLYNLTIEVDEIWFVDKFWPEGKDINEYETGSSIERPRRPSRKIDRTSYFRSSCTPWMTTAMRSKLKLNNLTDRKQEISHWTYRRVTPGCYSYVRGCVLTGVEQLYR